MVLDDPSGYGRVVRDADGAVERVVETKRPGDATDDELAIAEVNAGVYAFERAGCSTRWAASAPTTRRASCTCPAALELLREATGASPRRRVDDPTLLLGVNDRVELARVRRIAQQRIHEAHMRAGVTIVDPATTTIDVDVRIGADTVIEPSTFLRGATDDRRALHRRAAHDGDRRHARRRGLGRALLPQRLRDAGGRDGRPVRLPAARRAAARGLEGRDVRRDQELRHRRGHEGAAPAATSATPTSARARTSARRRSPPTTTGANKHRTTIGANVRTSVDTTLVAPVTVGDDAYTGPDRCHRRRARRRPGDRPRPPDEHRRLRRARRADRRRQPS